MSAPIKIPDTLFDDILVRYDDGWSLRRIAEWLGEEKQLQVSRTAVSNAIVRAGEIEPEPLDDAWSELVEEGPENLRKLNLLELKRQELLAALLDKSIAREDAQLVAKLIAQQERLLLWKIRTAGLRAPPPKSIHSFLPTIRSRPDLRMPAPPSEPPPSRPAQAPTPPPKPAASPSRPSVPEVSRNAPCPCGSTKKFKKCHGGPNPPVVVTNAVTHDSSL